MNEYKKKNNSFFKKYYIIGWLAFLLSAIFSSFIVWIFAFKKSFADNNMSQSEMIGHLMNEISALDSRFSVEVSWIIALVSLIGVVAGFYSYQQWKLSDNYISKIENEIANNFGIENIRSLLKKTRVEIKDRFKEQENLKTTMENNVDSLNSLIKQTRIDAKESKKDNFYISLNLMATLFESIDSSDENYKTRNKFLRLNRLLKRNKSVKVSNNEICDNLIPINTGLEETYNIKFDNKDAYELLGDSTNIIISMINFKDLKDKDKNSLVQFINSVNKITGKNFMPDSLK